MRMVSSTPQALSCCTVLLGSNLNGQQRQRVKLSSQQKREKGRKDAQKSLFEVVGFDAADVVRSGAVEGVHQHLQGLAELQSTAFRSKSRPIKHTEVVVVVVGAHLEAHSQFVLPGGSLPRPDAPVGHRGPILLLLLLEQLSHQLRLPHSHTQSNTSACVQPRVEKPATWLAFRMLMSSSKTVSRFLSRNPSHSYCTC